MIMTKAVMVVLSGPTQPDVEDEYNDWYDNQHLPDVCNTPGVVWGRRYRLSSSQIAPTDDAAPYLALYEFETDDVSKVLEDFATRSGDGRIRRSDTMASKAVLIYEER
jgi:hypothetical protein